jgi:Domain of unknown function (DUF4349)
MERFRDDDLAATLRGLRPTPRPAFAAALDERAAAGFPRRPADGSAVERLAVWVRSLRPRQVLLPAGVTALVAIVIATTVTLSGSGNDEAIVDQVAIGKQRPSSGSREIVPFSRSVKPLPKEMRHSWEASSSAGAGNNKYEASAAGASEHLSQQPRNSSGSYEGSGSGSGSYAFGATRRQVESAVQMVLGTDPAAVSDDAGKVFEAVHAYDGIVTRSSIRDGAEGDPRAEFDLLIPSAKLNDALAALSEIGEVRYRHEATTDITVPTVGVGDQLRDSRARIDSLLAQLAGAETESEREAIEAELRTERHRAAALRSRLGLLHRHANLSRVSLRIESGDPSAPSSSSGSWGPGDAVHDAGHILGVAAAVALVGLAVVAPIALIALLAWLAQRAWVRRGRERALG